MLDYEDVRIATNVFTAAAQAVANDLAAGDVGHEEDFSGQLVGRLKGRIDTLSTPNTRWSVGGAIVENLDGDVLQSTHVLNSVRFTGRQLKSKGVGSEESEVGADLLLVFDIQSRDYRVRKGALIQAKRLEAGKMIASAEAARLKSQCSDMLDITSESFVFLYASTGVTAISASSVEATSRRDLHSLEPYPHSVSIFFADFLLCWLGDPRLSSTNRDSLAVLRAEARARNALLIRANARK